MLLTCVNLYQVWQSTLDPACPKLQFGPDFEVLLSQVVTMSAAPGIDLHSSDKGLLSCFSLANIQESWRVAFLAKHQAESLEDFVFIVGQNTWEDDLKALLNEVVELKDSRLILARFKAAWKSGSAAIQAAQTAATKHEAADVEDPIPELQFQQLSADWQKSYRLVIESHLDPSDTLWARIWREFRRRCLTVIDIAEVKSVVGGTSPLDGEKISLDKGVVLQFSKAEQAAPRSVPEHYLKLRILCYAWAWAGNYKCQCVDGQEYIMCSRTAA